jgi:hypothetical protein
VNFSSGRVRSFNFRTRVSLSPPSQEHFTPTKRAENLLIKHLKQRPKGLLYHYTSMDALQSILTSGRIRASDALYLNDSTELTNARLFIQSLVETRLSTDTELSRKAEPHFSRLEDGKNSEVFVASFSEDGDSLPQWRGYGGDGFGVCIGFLPAAITAGILEGPDGSEVQGGGGRDFGFDLQKCVYTSKEKDKMLRETVDVFVEALKGKHHTIDEKRAGTLLGSLGSLCGPLFKDEGFSEEREWRLIVTTSNREFPKRHFRVGRSMFVPYICVDLRTNYLDFVKEIIVGPTPHPDLAARSLEKLLRSHELNRARVTNSRIPFRAW